MNLLPSNKGRGFSHASEDDHMDVFNQCDDLLAWLGVSNSVDQHKLMLHIHDTSFRIMGMLCVHMHMTNITLHFLLIKWSAATETAAVHESQTD